MDHDERIEKIFSDTPAPCVLEGSHRARLKAELMESTRKENVIMIIMRKTRSRGIRWAAAAAVAVLVGVLVFGLNPWSDGLARSYAAAVQQIRNARTMTYKMTIPPMAEGMPAMTMEMMYREPGLLRMNIPMGGFAVIDMIEKKGLSVMTPLKQFIEQDLSKMPPDQVQKATNYIDEMRNLPGRADEVLGEKEMDGRTVRGFHVLASHGETGALEGMDATVWVDAKTGELIRIEGELTNAKGLRVTMTDFHFDVDLDDSLFSLAPPEGYSRLNIQPDASAPDEKDLVKFLRFYAEIGKDEVFPPSVNPAELVKHVMTLGKEDKLSGKMFGLPADMTKEEMKEREREMTKEEKKKMKEEAMRKSLEVGRGVMFVMQMKPENDWHYAGEGVRLGDADTPICWWKPSEKSGETESSGFQVWRPGTETYRVIYGDLSVRDVAPEDLPSR